MERNGTEMRSVFASSRSVNQKGTGIFMGIEEKYFMDGPFGRFIRAALTVALTGFVARNQNNVWYVAAAPLIQAGAKWLRDTYPGKLEWLPI